jgi:predicted nuclease of restriction endonuclease-like (RecB) superfamily
MKGFSPRNLGYMKRLAQTYSNESILQQAVAKLPWGHNILLLEKVKDETERLWYIEHALRYGWSRNVLDLQIETKLYHRQGKALTNFPQTLPALDSDLATEALKDPYIFDWYLISAWACCHCSDVLHCHSWTLPKTSPL